MAPKVIVLCVAIVLSIAGWFFLSGNDVDAPVAPETLTYPCVRVIDDSLWDRIDVPDDLRFLASGRYMGRRSEPIVIDSDLRVFEMSETAMTSNEVWLIFTGPRTVEVEFKLLARTDMAAEDALAVLKTILQDRPLMPDGWGEQVGRATTLKALIELLETPIPKFEPKLDP